ncbi:MAG: hypothetical protein [Anelloviridae sp.]|nr:MAG: hypothetical protein [Anelloviridae sp.]
MKNHMILVHSPIGLFPITSMKQYKSRIQTHAHKQNSKNGTGDVILLQKKLSKELDNTRNLMKLCKSLQVPNTTHQYTDKHHRGRTQKRTRKRKKTKHKRSRSSSTSSESINSISSSSSSST